MTERHADVLGKPFDEIPNEDKHYRCYSRFTNKAVIIKADKNKQALPAPADYDSSESNE